MNLIMHPFCCVSTVNDRNSQHPTQMTPPNLPAAGAAGARSDQVRNQKQHANSQDYGRLSQRMVAPATAELETARPPEMREATQLLSGDQREVKINDIVGNGISGILYKWVNYGRGWRPRWFVLQDGVFSYYKIRGPDKIVVSQESEKGSRVIGEESFRRISRHKNGGSQLHRKPVGEVHLKVSTIRMSRSDDKRFSIFTGTKTLRLRAETRDDRLAWVDALQAVKDMFPRMSNSELIAPVIVSTEKLRQQLLEEGVRETVIQESEHIMRNEFSALQNQLMVLKQKHWLLLDTLRQLETEKVDLENTVVDESQRQMPPQDQLGSTITAASAQMSPCGSAGSDIDLADVFAKFLNQSSSDSSTDPFMIGSGSSDRDSQLEDPDGEQLEDPDGETLMPSRVSQEANQLVAGISDHQIDQHEQQIHEEIFVGEDPRFLGMEAVFNQDQLGQDLVLSDPANWPNFVWQPMVQLQDHQFGQFSSEDQWKINNSANICNDSWSWFDQSAYEI